MEKGEDKNGSLVSKVTNVQESDVTQSRSAKARIRNASARKLPEKKTFLNWIRENSFRFIKSKK